LNRSGLRTVVAIVAVFAAFALPAQASAQNDPTASQYSSTTNITTGGESVSGGGSSSLPFTGLDVISLLAIAGALTGTGLVLRRLTVHGGGQGR
jgi:hypothetical protein